jgi:type IV pilus assembly protein PilA
MFMIKKLAAGFTLLELMIVVAIIGILVALAAPNFAKYQARSRQSEAKLALGTIYTGEKSFFGEHSAFIQGMDNIGYTPEGSKRFYSVGWTAVTNAGSITNYNALAATASYARVNFPAAWSDCTLATLSSTPGATALDAQAFTVIATGQLNDGITDCDTWSIDQDKTLLNTTIGM